MPLYLQMQRLGSTTSSKRFSDFFFFCSKANCLVEVRTLPLQLLVFSIAFTSLCGKGFLVYRKIASEKTFPTVCSIFENYMAQKKLYRFGQIKIFENVLEYPENMKGKWNRFFKNNHPVILELACGRGEYTVALAAMHPHKNFIGVDIKGNRMYIGAKKALENHLTNAAFLRTQIEMLGDYFNTGEVDEIWITFPDPQLRTSKAKKRLTHPRFLRLFLQILKPGGYIHLKTDSPQLYTFTLLVIEKYRLKLLEKSDNVYAGNYAPELGIKTFYESLDIANSNKIHYLKFQLPAQLPNIDKEFQDMLRQTENIMQTP